MLVPCAKCRKPLFVGASQAATGATLTCSHCNTILSVAAGGQVRVLKEASTSPHNAKNGRDTPPDSDHTSEKTPDPVPEVAPPVAESTPDPVSELSPPPVAELTPDPVLELSPPPVAELTPDPVLLTSSSASSASPALSAPPAAADLVASDPVLLEAPHPIPEEESALSEVAPEHSEQSQLLPSDDSEILSGDSSVEDAVEDTRAGSAEEILPADSDFNSDPVLAADDFPGDELLPSPSSPSGEWDLPEFESGNSSEGNEDAATPSIKSEDSELVLKEYEVTNEVDDVQPHQPVTYTGEEGLRSPSRPDAEAVSTPFWGEKSRRLSASENTQAASPQNRIPLSRPDLDDFNSAPPGIHIVGGAGASDRRWILGVAIASAAMAVAVLAYLFSGTQNAAVQIREPQVASSPAPTVAPTAVEEAAANHDDSPFMPTAAELAALPRLQKTPLSGTKTSGKRRVKSRKRTEADELGGRDKSNKNSRETSVPRQLLAQANRYLTDGNPDLAVQALNEATRIKPRFPMAWRSLGIAYMMKGDEQRALRAYEKFLKQAPKHPEAPEIRDLLKAGGK
ncbi:tetratricopeptide repeat protein [Myxococcota bacterium]|nr:tetratricopeptide repeat protein [Myxococcota bacterium]